MVPGPVTVDIRRGALHDLPNVLADQRISAGGQVAVVVGPSFGATLVDTVRHRLGSASIFTLGGGTVDAALELADAIRRAGTFDAVIALGGGRVIDATKYLAARLGLPTVAVATNLAHDGIYSPVSILDNDSGRGSYGVPAPLAVLIDLDLVAAAPRRSVTAGIGEVLSNLSAIADWELSRTETGEQVDGLALTFARSAAQAVLHAPGTADDDAFLVTLAESLVLSGLAMVVAGTSRPSSGACHELSHAIDHLYSDRRRHHGEQVGVGAAFASWLRKDTDNLERTVVCLRRHGLPVTPAELGFTVAEYADAAVYAPQTRPGRFTVLEHLRLDRDALGEAVTAFTAAVS